MIHLVILKTNFKIVYGFLYGIPYLKPVIKLYEKKNVKAYNNGYYSIVEQWDV